MSAIVHIFRKGVVIHVHYALNLEPTLAINCGFKIEQDSSSSKRLVINFVFRLFFLFNFPVL